MAARLSRKRLPRYGLEFKLAAVKLTEVPGVEVQAVAQALDIHPVMLSRWRQEAREGRLRGFVPRPRVVETKVRVPAVREIKRLQALEKAHALLQEEHALLKKAIRFASERRPTSSPSSKRSGGRTR
jgi:transposase